MGPAASSFLNVWVNGEQTDREEERIEMDLGLSDPARSGAMLYNKDHAYSMRQSRLRKI